MLIYYRQPTMLLLHTYKYMLASLPLHTLSFCEICFPALGSAHVITKLIKSLTRKNKKVKANRRIYLHQLHLSMLNQMTVNTRNKFQFIWEPKRFSQESMELLLFFSRIFQQKTSIKKDEIKIIMDLTPSKKTLGIA